MSGIIKSKVLNRIPGKVSLIFFVAMTVLPLFAGLSYALRYSFGWAGIIDNGFTLSHWAKFWSTSELWVSILFSIYITVASLLITLVTALFLALKGSKLFKKGILSYLIYFPLAFPAIVAALFVFQQLSKAGFISRLAYHINLIDNLNQFPDVINDTYGIGIILTHVLLAVPFFVIYFSSVIQHEQLSQQEEIAKTLGARNRDILARISLPIILKSSRSTILLYAIFIMGSYEVPLILGRQSPQMISVMTVRNLKHFDLTNIPQAYIIALLYTLLILFALYFSLGKTNKAGAI